MAHTGACTKLKEIHINSQCTIFANLTISTFQSMYKAEKQNVYCYFKSNTECDS